MWSAFDCGSLWLVAQFPAPLAGRGRSPAAPEGGGARRVSSGSERSPLRLRPSWPSNGLNSPPWHAELGPCHGIVGWTGSGAGVGEGASPWWAGYPRVRGLVGWCPGGWERPGFTYDESIAFGSPWQLALLVRHVGAAAPLAQARTPEHRGDLLSLTPVSDLTPAQVSGFLKDAGVDSATVRYGVRGYRLTYRTITPQGRPTTATGLLVLPVDGRHAPARPRRRHPRHHGRPGLRALRRRGRRPALALSARLRRPGRRRARLSGPRQGARPAPVHGHRLVRVRLARHAARHPHRRAASWAAR